MSTDRMPESPRSHLVSLDISKWRMVEGRVAPMLTTPMLTKYALGFSSERACKIIFNSNQIKTRFPWSRLYGSEIVILTSDANPIMQLFEKIGLEGIDELFVRGARSGYFGINIGRDPIFGNMEIFGPGLGPCELINDRGEVFQNGTIEEALKPVVG